MVGSSHYRSYVSLSVPVSEDREIKKNLAPSNQRIVAYTLIHKNSPLGNQLTVRSRHRTQTNTHIFRKVYNRFSPKFFLIKVEAFCPFVGKSGQSGRLTLRKLIGLRCGEAGVKTRGSYVKQAASA